MASIQGSNPLDRLAAYFKPCTRQFSQEEYYNFEDTLSELRDNQPKNPLDNLDVFFRPLAKESNDEIEIEGSIGIDKIKSPKSNEFSSKSSTKRRKVDSFNDEYKSLPLLSTMTTSSDTSSSESSDEEEGDNYIFSSSSSSKYGQQDADDIDLTSETELQFDDNIIENLKTLSLISDNIATTARKIAKPRSKKQVVALNEDLESPMTEKRNEKSRSDVVWAENPEDKDKGKEVSWTVSKRIGRGDQKISNKNGTPEAPIAGFIGSRAHKYLDMLDNQTFKTRHRKIITKRIRETNLSDGLSSLLSSGFKPTNMLNE